MEVRAITYDAIIQIIRVPEQPDARGRFTLKGRTYRLAIHNGPNHLHGGLKGTTK